MAHKISRRGFFKKTARLTAAAGITGAGANFFVGCTPKEFNLVVKNGMIYDGTGGAPYAGDIGIKGERIAEIGDLNGRTARKIIDVGGLAVAPGFIDAHTHTDITLLVNPNAESKIRQGITTEIGGNCGDSVFPLGGFTGADRRETWQKGFEIEVDWSNADEFLSRVEKNGTSMNYLTLVGHGAIRGVVMGPENRDPSSEELKAMQDLVRESMEQGAYGLSSGLEYTPGSFAKTEELIELCKVITEYEGIYATHMRSEDVMLEEAVEEAIRIARESGAQLQISHLKASQQRNWHKLSGVLTMLAKASRQGVKVYADRYPYTAFATTLQIMFPLWSREGDSEAFVARLKDDSLWTRIKPYLVDRVNALGSWESVLVTKVKSKDRAHFHGRTIAALASDANADPFDFARELLIEEEGHVDMCGFGMSEKNTDKVLAFPLTMVGSDSTAVAPYGSLRRGNPHPRHYGAFPRYLGYYVREREILPLPDAVRRITALPAQTFGLEDRGSIAAGKYADITVFDPDTVIDKATFTDAHQYPEGIPYVIVNGQVVIEKGTHTEHYPGKVLRNA